MIVPSNSCARPDRVVVQAHTALMAAGRRAVVASALAGVLGTGGCVESQFALRVRSQDPISVWSRSEPVERARDAAAPAGAPFADRGVLLHSGSELRYGREGDWIASEAPVAAAAGAGDTLRVEYTLHPGRRDLPMLLETPTSNVCDLRVRSRPSRGLAYASLITAGTGALFGSLTALSHGGTARGTVIGLGAGAGALAIIGVTLLLWPPYGERALIENGCRGG